VRDLLVMSLVMAFALAALRQPWVGVIGWTWLSLMSPHRYTWGFALDAPVTLIVAVYTLIGLVFTKNRWSPFRGAPVVWFALFTVWVTISWLAGPDISGQYEQWDKIMKINLMVLVTLALLRTKFHIYVFLAVCAFSLAVLGAKGGFFTILTGGVHRVWGPSGTFVGGNNEFALALVMTIPLLRCIQMQMTSVMQRNFMTVVMVLCAAAALGSHSRGALLAIAAMGAMLWWRGSRNRFSSGLLLAVLVFAAVSFLPAEWFMRMDTIETYQEDASALGRLAAWSLAWNAALSNFFGLGLEAAVPEYFVAYSSYGLAFGTPAAHSIYFQVLGHHGFVGAFLFIGIWLSTWRMASGLRRDARKHPDAAWCGDMGALMQVSLVGYLVGGSFLSLAYYDLPYNIMALVVLTRCWLNRQAWLTEPQMRPMGWGMWRPLVAAPASSKA